SCGFRAQHVLHSVPTRRSSDLCARSFKASPCKCMNWSSLPIMRPPMGLVSSMAQLWAGRPTPIGQERRLLYGYSPLGLHGSSLRSEEHTSELQSRENLVCRLLL